MKKIKILAVGLVLALSGVVYAFSGSESASDSCPLVQMGCPFCKAKK